MEEHLQLFKITIIIIIITQFDMNFIISKEIENFGEEDYSLWLSFYMCKIL